MKALLPLVTLTLFLLVACGEKKPEASIKDRPILTGEPSKDIVMLLPLGHVTVERMDGLSKSARLSQLYKVYQKNIRERYDWYVEYLESNSERPVPYHENFGLSPEEYAEMNEHIGNVRYYSTGMQDMEIVHRGEAIGFEAEKKLEAFKSVAINPYTLQAYVGERELALTDTTGEATEKNPFGTPWTGYIWRYENPENIHLEALKDLENLNVVQYKITLAQLQNSGRTLITLKCVEVEQGFKLIDVDLSVVF